MIREPIGDIPCPWCARAAELHSSDMRPKVSPDAEGRASYPKKMFVICPPIPGYRGCGTTLANNQYAQRRMLELGRVFGPDGAPAATPPAPSPEPVPPPKPAASSLFGKFR